MQFAVCETRDLLLHCIVVELGMYDKPNLTKQKLQLLKYHPCDENTGNLCKDFSDYGKLMLILIDIVSGLEAFIGGEWRSVPCFPEKKQIKQS